MRSTSEDLFPGLCAVHLRAVGEVGEGKLQSQGVPGHGSPAERTRTACQAPEAEEEYRGAHLVGCRAHPTIHCFKILQLSFRNI